MEWLGMAVAVMAVIVVRVRTPRTAVLTMIVPMTMCVGMVVL
jgi:hypothetical protein